MNTAFKKLTAKNLKYLGKKEEKENVGRPNATKPKYCGYNRPVSNMRAPQACQ